MIALLLGRFQPWHKDHQKCVEIIRKYGADNIIIGLRPAGIKPGDFLTIEQRIEIIQIAIPDAIIVPAENIPDYDVGFSCNPEVQEIYKQHGKQVIKLPRFGGSATEIRQRLELGLDIRDLVMPGTAGLIWQFWGEHHGCTA